MQLSVIKKVSPVFLVAALASCAHWPSGAATPADALIGRYAISTMPVRDGITVHSASFTPSGKVLLSYAENGGQDRRELKLATINDDGTDMHTFFSEKVPDREKSNGIRLMVFPDNKRIFLGDFVIECVTVLEACEKPTLLPVQYPAEVAGGDDIVNRWSEVIVAPDNRHIAWTTLLANYSAMMFTGELQKAGSTYKIIDTQIVSSLNPFDPDPAHADGVLPTPVRNGEVKQFVHGGTALSVVGAVGRDVPDSVVQDLVTGRKRAITDTPGYTETTIFSPDERLGLTMSTRFSKMTDPAILGLMPRPYPDSLNMGLSMFAYTYAVTGVRRGRQGNIGPALIDIAASESTEGYRGIDLNTEEDWVYHSPMSWHPDGKKAMWIEGRRNAGNRRVQIVTLPDYRPAAPVAAQPTPDPVPYASTDLSAVGKFATANQDIDVKVYGHKSGYIRYRRTPEGETEKTYVDFSDDGEEVYSGSEKMDANPRGRSTYTAKIKLVGPRSGAMDLKMTFGPLGGELPARLIFSPDEAGEPLTRGDAEYDGRRIDVNSLVP